MNRFLVPVLLLAIATLAFLLFQPGHSESPRNQLHITIVHSSPKGNR